MIKASAAGQKLGAPLSKLDFPGLACSSIITGLQIR